ncbi:TetR/AcrR family transcriptional regulator [Luteithermobacter gelatinilyticus]|uniref:TetR/AcrR family transcriptional regulator n=1 Tax=Luteithermobacter gelatinilyticus TaxID=2582913 RepID=UPI00143D2E91|nr:TetR/AcrR family transcriptional regulator [Luteithermobacter gelatinilyticus]|tara:strand:+ start:8818 stop:9375 length:558 start_codon:yes stop_codon:yes gene_type:complete
MASSRRDHLVDTAVRLFNRYGYHATGIDTILKEAGVAKMTLYNHFKSKDDLVVAALKKKEQFFADQYRLKTAGWDLKPRGRLNAIIEVYEDWFRSPDFNGCMFLRGAGEYADPRSPVFQTIRAHKETTLKRYAGLGAELGMRDPFSFASQLMVIIDGAIQGAKIFGAEPAIKTMRTMVNRLVEGK